MKSKLELWLGWIGAGLSLVFLGGFSFMMNQVSVDEFENAFFDVFESMIRSMGIEEAYQVFRTLGAWFGFTLLAVLILVSVASLLIGYRNYRKRAGIIYLLCGVTCLIGSQLIAFPIAFFFFLSGGLCFLRKVGKDTQT